MRRAPGPRPPCRAQDHDRSPGNGARTIAIAGASGYVGRLLAGRLAEAGHQVRALGRHPDILPTGDRISVVAVDVADPEATARALVGADAAYYLVHTMAAGTGFEHATARTRLPSPGPPGTPVSSASSTWAVWAGATCRHTWSVARRWALYWLPLVCRWWNLRAAVILGAGSISYEMLRSLTERLPVMVCPRWITTRLQPLAESDLLDYLAGSLVAPPGVYEIGTPDVTDYGTMMRSYAEAGACGPGASSPCPSSRPHCRPAGWTWSAQSTGASATP